MNLRPAIVLTSLLLPLTAQQGNLDEFLKLEPVLQAALKRAGPFVVTVETFGGTRHSMGKDGPTDGPAPPKPRPKPKKVEPTPVPTPDELPKPLKPGEKPKEKPGEKPSEGKQDPKNDKPEKKDKKKKLGLVATGFQQTQGKTSGIVLTSDGWIMISRFALNLNPTTILINVPGHGTYHAERVGEDTSRGIALVKIDAVGLPVPKFVHPNDVRVGQWAFALGRTFAEAEPTVHLGIVSAKNRLFGRALQIDAYTSPANYGGAVVDIHGRVLGISVPLSPSGRNAGVEWYDSGIGFATTIGDIQGLVKRMKEGQILQRAWLGVQLSTSHLGPGAKITGTPKDGAAKEAGLRKGDIILEVDGVHVLNGPHFQMLVSSRLGGETCTLIVKKKRKDEPIEVGPITLKNAPWSEQRKGKEDLPASFSLPEKEDGR
ncbi:MAG TPA: PDZ domain-containing protein [Planctomycetes bacterium]|nr:PDZ domain-containing protein [Planctomycetota bacterium]